MALVMQSYRDHDVPGWIQQCLVSVQQWASLSGETYHCAGDAELLSCLPTAFRKKLDGRWPMLADLGRLKLAQQALDNGEERVVWIDADVFVLRPDKPMVPEDLPNGYAFGREFWIEASGKVRKGVHNAICVFEQGNPFLEYYIHACERIVAEHTGEQLAPQLLGPKFLKMQSNLLKMDLLDSVGMVSPVVTANFLVGDGELWRKQLELQDPAAVNLCGSLMQGSEANSLLGKLVE